MTFIPMTKEARERMFRIVGSPMDSTKSGSRAITVALTLGYLPSDATGADRVWWEAFQKAREAHGRRLAAMSRIAKHFPHGILYN